MSSTEVLNGEVSTGAVLNAGDTQLIDLGGIANLTTINSHGLQILAPGAVTSDVTVNAGGSQSAGVGGQTYGTVLNGGEQDLSYYIVAHGTPQFSIQGAEGTIINAGGVQNDSGRAVDTVINAGGVQNARGYATHTEINAGGVQKVDVGYLSSPSPNTTFVDGTVVNSGGVQNIISGSASNTHLMSGGSITFQADTYADGGTVQFVASTGTLTITDNGQVTTANLAGDYSNTTFTLSGQDGKLTVTATTLCFCRGTMILTPAGEVAVESLRVGGTVETASGRAAVVQFIGSAASLVTEENRPVTIRRGALARNTPHRDLRVTRGHSFLFADVLIPIGQLINGNTIAFDISARSVEVYHVGLATHDILLADGAPAESFRDDGNGAAFTGSRGDRGAPKTIPTYAAVVTRGPVVDRTRARLAARADIAGSAVRTLARGLISNGPR